MTTTPTINLVTGCYAIVALRENNDPAFVVRTFPTYAAALGYLGHNLPKRKNLDMVDPTGAFVDWNLTPRTIASAKAMVSTYGAGGTYTL